MCPFFVETIESAIRHTQNPGFLEDCALASLIGLVVTEIVSVHDYVQSVFGSDARLSVYNDFRILPEKAVIDELIGLTVTIAQSSDDEALIEFQGGLALRVDLRAAAFHGPESMQLNRARHPVVWN